MRPFPIIKTLKTENHSKLDALPPRAVDLSSSIGISKHVGFHLNGNNSID